MSNCPRCGLPLTRDVIEKAKTRIDRCQSCDGAWVDSGELSQLAESGVSR